MPRGARGAVQGAVQPGLVGGGGGGGLQPWAHTTSAQLLLPGDTVSGSSTHLGQFALQSLGVSTAMNIPGGFIGHFQGWLEDTSCWSHFQERFAPWDSRPRGLELGCGKVLCA